MTGRTKSLNELTQYWKQFQRAHVFILTAKQNE